MVGIEIKRADAPDHHRKTGQDERDEQDGEMDNRFEEEACDMCTS
jgi:hypothetical protein